nr:hypothetical protein [uncultured Carboxylicivirga sp.]
MKKHLQIPFLFLILTTLFSSCSKDDDTEQFSSYSAAEDKQNIVNAGIDLANETKGLAQTEFAKVSVNLMDYLKLGISSRQNWLYTITEIGKNMNEEAFIQTQFEELMSVTTNSCHDLSIIWNQGYGIWVWNTQISDFEQISDEGDEITFLFPSEANSTINNTSLRLYDFTNYNGYFPDKGTILENGTVLNEILQSLYLDMKVDDKLIASSNIIIDYSDWGNIENMNLTFNPIPYSFQAEMLTLNNNASWRYTLMSDVNLVFEQYIAGTYEDNSQTNRTLNNIYSSTQIDNIKLIIEANSADLLDQISAIENKELLGEESAIQKATSVNNNTKISIRYANDAIIALGTPTARNTNEETDEWILDLAFKFSDDSNEYLTNLIDYIYLFEDNLDLILKKTQNKIN